ncbi:hypothetical protein [Streptomyces sp. NPDC050355]|uniref:hypothetical protein n=1 Tax=Streptomyces sp. NPDC050355 TaxID=3365609 RepID=UPI0037B56DC2
MSTDADFADARHIPPIPPRPPQQPPVTPAPQPHTDPRTTVLRRVPSAPPAPPTRAQAAQPPADPTPPQRPAPPATPPRPAVPPPAPPTGQPPRPHHAPGSPAPAAAPPPPRRPDTFRDTAAFHLANSQEMWNGAPAPAAGTPPRPRKPASATPSAAPGSEPPTPAAERPPQPPWPGTPLPHQTPGAAPGIPAGTRPRPSAGRRLRGRLGAAAACLVLGIGLIGGAAAGSWLTADSADAPPTPEAAFAAGRDVWRNTPVDTLFPRTIQGLGVGPGGADRTWTRIAVAPDSGCTGAYDRPLAQVLARAGCVRLLRATYLDATRSSVITVGVQTAEADAAGMMALNARFSTKSLGSRTDLMPLPYAAKGTPAEGFGRAQRASWTVRVLTDIPVIVFAVSGFADGRAVSAPQSAEAAVRPGATTAPAESGLGHDAKDIADRIAADFRTASGISPHTTESSP